MRNRSVPVCTMVCVNKCIHVRIHSHILWCRSLDAWHHAWMQTPCNYIYGCVCIHVRTYVFICESKYMCIYMHVTGIRSFPVYTTCKCLYMMYACTSLCINTCTYVYMHGTVLVLCTFIYLSIYVYIYARHRTYTLIDSEFLQFRSCVCFGIHLYVCIHFTYEVTTQYDYEPGHTDH